MMHKVMAVAVVALMMGGSMLLPAKAQAADFEIETVFEDSLYGAAIGALVGAGVMLVSSKPTDHWNYITTGAGVGIIGGALYGVYSSSSRRGLAEYEDGKLRIAMPTPQINLNGNDVAMQVDMFKSRF